MKVLNLTLDIYQGPEKREYKLKWKCETSSSVFQDRFQRIAITLTKKDLFLFA